MFDKTNLLKKSKVKDETKVKNITANTYHNSDEKKFVKMLRKCQNNFFPFK